jgi:hypothetical protein
MAEHSAGAPSEVIAEALRQQDNQSQAELEKYGPRLNTVTSMVCPECHRMQRMTVHPEHRVYQLCKHAFPLPPIGITNPRRKRTAAEPKGATK